MNKEENMKLSAPWIIYANQIEAMFKEDRDIEFEYDDSEKVITLRVNGDDKADALTQLLPAEQNFGGTTIRIDVIPTNENDTKVVDLFRRAFNGNPILSEITSIETLWGVANFVVFKPKVVQYYDDNMFSINGIKTTVYQDLAKAVFGNNGNVHYCTEELED